MAMEGGREGGREERNEEKGKLRGGTEEKMGVERAEGGVARREIGKKG